MATKITIRARFNPAINLWRIFHKTAISAGGWRMFGNSHGYSSKIECEAQIRFLIEKNPELYQEG